MKSEDFERLKAVCEKEGFKLSLDAIEGFHKEYVFRVISKKDIWEGVEFAEDTQGKIWPIRNPDFDRKPFKPSTESAYIEQLKAQAFKKFGEIKDGDRFEACSGYKSVGFGGNPKWDYFKDDDQLFYYNIEVYKKGKWATRVPERVKVLFDGGNLQSRQFFFIYGNDAENKMQEKGCFKIGEFLAQQLEEYLNK